MRSDAKIAVHLGFKVHLGWVAVVVAPQDAPEPTALAAERLDLFTREGRQVKEPYHVAGGWDGLQRVARPPDPEAVIAQARETQATLVTGLLRAYRRTLKQQGQRWAQATILTGRGRVNVPLEKILRSHAQIHVAEGELVRDSLRNALKAMRVRFAEQDEKRALAAAASTLERDPTVLAHDLKVRRPDVAKQWTKEHQVLTAACWLSSRSGP